MSFEKSTWRRAAAATTAAAFFFGGLGGSVLTAAPVVSPIEIAHDPLTCVNTDFAPRVDAAVAPGKDLDKSYVYFKAAGEEDFYYAVMKGEPQKLEGVLPRPLPETRAIDYKIRATDVRDLVKEKGEFTPPVVPGNACRAKGVPVGKDGAGLTIGLTRSGQNPVPRGFNRKDIAFVILFGGATVSLADALKGSGSASSAAAAGSSSAAAGGATGASAGAGISTGVAVGVGAAVAAGAAIIIVNNNRGSSKTNTPTVTPTFTPSPTRTFTPTPALRFIEADATWSGIGNITVEIRDPGNLVVGTNLPAGCESTASRTERVILQGALAPGTYRVLLTASDCSPAGAPPSIAAAVTVQSDLGPKCPTAFKNVPLGTTVEGCSFTVP